MDVKVTSHRSRRAEPDPTAPAVMHPGNGSGGTVSDVPQDLAELIEALSDPRFHLHEPEQVDVLETHISVLFFAGHLVYKLKKAVDLGFLDHRALATRRAVCAAEVRLNARLAPGVYRGVVPITRESDGTLCLDGDGDVVDVVVEMERLPAERMLDRLLDGGVIDTELVHELAEMLAVFHQEARTGEGVDAFGTPDAVRKLVLDNLDELRPYVGSADAPSATGVTVLPADVHAHLLRKMIEFVEMHSRLLERRVQTGRIVDGHGDLHAGNICRTADGLLAYDCIEFSAAFRCGDVAADLAFLAMDLDSRGFRAFSRHLVQEYQDLSHDRELGYLMDFYKTHRALVRAKVAALTALQKAPGSPERDAEHRRAMRAVHLAVSYQLPPALTLMCGLPASGKSWLARHLARPFEARVVRSDVVRKQLAGLPPSTRPSPAEAKRLYSQESSDRLYEHLAQRTFQWLSGGRSVVVDAMFGTASQRRRFLDVARRLDVPATVVRVHCPEDVIRERMQARADTDSPDASDADWDVYQLLTKTFETPSELHSSLCLSYTSGDDVDECVMELLAAFISQDCSSTPAGSRPAREDPS